MERRQLLVATATVTAAGFVGCGAPGGDGEVGDGEEDGDGDEENEAEDEEGAEGALVDERGADAGGPNGP